MRERVVWVREVEIIGLGCNAQTHNVFVEKRKT